MKSQLVRAAVGLSALLRLGRAITCALSIKTMETNFLYNFTIFGCKKKKQKKLSRNGIKIETKKNAHNAHINNKGKTA